MTDAAGGAVTSADVVVVGLGVGGEAVAGGLAEESVDVIGIEAELVGGECPYWACIPSKMMIRAGNLVAEARRVGDLAGAADVRPSWAPVARRIRDEATDDWDDRVAVDRFTGKGGRFLRGAATVTGPRTVEVQGVGVVEARRGLVLATGTTAALPPVDGLADTPFWTNREATSADELPVSLVVLGGGAVGVELGQTFARFGVDVTIVEAADRLLPAEEPEASAVLAAALRDEGLDLRLGSRAREVRHDAGGFTVELDGGPTLQAERLLVATGRTPRVDPATLTALGLDPDLRTLPVDERLRVTDGVWAVGDVTGRGPFTHVATYQADVVVDDVLGREGPPADYRALPRVTFTDPEVGAVGLTEAAAREQGIPVATGLARVPETARGWIHGVGNEGLVKLVADTRTGLLVGPPRPDPPAARSSALSRSPSTDVSPSTTSGT